ncbi:MAG: glycosyltransferase family 4 protein [Proteobacteria bacterium]|nr:glycosyltransferase family 4 protein [Pseudomonadota bacterium]
MTTKRILFVSKGTHAASTRYRALHYFDCLQQAGWQTEHFTAHSSPVSRIRLLLKARQFHTVVIVRRLFPAWFMGMLQLACDNIVFDFDDAIFTHSSGANAARRIKRFTTMVVYCNQVWAGNGFLANAASKNNNVMLLPTAINTGHYAVNTVKPETSIDLVWIGSSSTRKYLELVLPILESLATELPQLRLKIIADFSLDTRQIKTLPVQWAEDTEAMELASSHIGIAPMIDNDWTRGKCGLKLLQYMAAGLPVISSPFGANREIVIEGETGLFADSEQQWKNAIRTLASNVDLRQRMGNTGKQRVLDHYSINTNCEKIKKALS